MSWCKEPRALAGVIKLWLQGETWPLEDLGGKSHISLKAELRQQRNSGSQRVSHTKGPLVGNQKSIREETLWLGVRLGLFGWRSKGGV